MNREQIWLENGIDSTIHDFDFTKKAMQDMYHVITSDSFEDMNPDVIYRYLSTGINFNFKDYLKRYLYVNAGIREDYNTVENSVYLDIIRESFRENCAPQSFSATTKNWTTTIKGWLQASAVKRPTVFLLGFGLRMNVEDVSTFLTKVLQEQDFNFYDKNEAIYWFCFKNQLRYPKAQELLQKYEALPFLVLNDMTKPESEKEIKDFLTEEQALITYLTWLKAIGIDDENQRRAEQRFSVLLKNAKELIAEIYNQDEEEKKSRKVWTADMVTSGDVEKVIYCGVPVNDQGNLWKISRSCLKDRFRQCMLNRQRIDKIQKRKIRIERYDLITLNFFKYSQMEYEDPHDRCKEFIKNTNVILSGCGMNEVYPAHPYESFVLLCLLSESPLAMYADIWEMSYQQED